MCGWNEAIRVLSILVATCLRAAASLDRGGPAPPAMFDLQRRDVDQAEHDMFHARHAADAWVSTPAITDRPALSVRVCAPAWAHLEHDGLRLTGRSGRSHEFFFMRTTRQAHPIGIPMRAKTALASSYMEFIV
jgi:hypothetical protein